MASKEIRALWMWLPAAMPSTSYNKKHFLHKAGKLFGLFLCIWSGGQSFYLLAVYVLSCSDHTFIQISAWPRPRPSTFKRPKSEVRFGCATCKLSYMPCLPSDIQMIHQLQQEVMLYWFPLGETHDLNWCFNHLEVMGRATRRNPLSLFLLHLFTCCSRSLFVL